MCHILVEDNMLTSPNCEKSRKCDSICCSGEFVYQVPLIPMTSVKSSTRNCNSICTNVICSDDLVRIISIAATFKAPQ